MKLKDLQAASPHRERVVVQIPAMSKAELYAHPLPWVKYQRKREKSNLSRYGKIATLVPQEDLVALQGQLAEIPDGTPTDEVEAALASANTTATASGGFLQKIASLGEEELDAYLIDALPPNTVWPVLVGWNLDDEWNKKAVLELLASETPAAVENPNGAALEWDEERAARWEAYNGMPLGEMICREVEAVVDLDLKRRTSEEDANAKNSVSGGDSSES